MIQTLIQSAAEGYASCEVNADGEIDAECETETIKNAIGLVDSIRNLRRPKFADAIGTAAVIASALPCPIVPAVLEAGAVFVEKLEKGERPDVSTLWDMGLAASAAAPEVKIAMQIATICKEIGQITLNRVYRATGVSPGWAPGYDRSCWVQTKNREFKHPYRKEVKCDEGWTHDPDLNLCLGPCTQGGTGAGLVCQGSCPPKTTLIGSICIDNKMDPSKYGYGTLKKSMIEYAGTNTYSNFSKYIRESKSVEEVLKGNLQTMATDIAFEAIMFGAANARSYSLTRCNMYTPTAMWQDSIRKVMDKN